VLKKNSLFSAYRNAVYKNASTPKAKTDALQYWRNNLFAATVFYLIPLSLIALIPGVYLAYTEGLLFLVLADIFAVGSLLTIAFVPGMKVYSRKILFCLAFYMVSLALLFYLGTFGPGLMYLLAFTVFVVLIFERKYGFWVVFVNTLICIFIGYAIHHQLWSDIILPVYDLENWIAVSSNLIFLSFLTVILIPKLFRGLQGTIEEQNRLKSELEQNQTKLESSLNQLEQKNSELEEFAYAASHDMKEPLRMVRSFLKLLNDRYIDLIDERGKKYIHFAVDGAERLNVFIDDLLEYSRVGRMYDSFEGVDVGEVAKDVAKVYKKDKLYSRAIINCGELPTIHAVPVSVKMLFQNLIGNALKYQRKGMVPEISVSCEDIGEYWKFRVSDNGIGIKKEYFDQIFQIFNRLHSNDVYSGTGVGLAICRKITEQHGGTIWVESSEGKGSDFFFTFPKSDLL